MSRRLAVSQLPKLRATQECDLSAGSSAGMAGGGAAAPDLKSAPPIRNLLRSKIGLDNGGHFTDTIRSAFEQKRKPTGLQNRLGGHGSEASRAVDIGALGCIRKAGDGHLGGSNDFVSTGCLAGYRRR